MCFVWITHEKKERKKKEKKKKQFRLNVLELPYLIIF